MHNYCGNVLRFQKSFSCYVRFQERARKKKKTWKRTHGCRLPRWEEASPPLDLPPLVTSSTAESRSGTLSPSSLHPIPSPASAPHGRLGWCRNYSRWGRHLLPPPTGRHRRRGSPPLPQPGDGAGALGVRRRNCSGLGGAAAGPASDDDGGYVAASDLGSSAAV